MEQETAHMDIQTSHATDSDGPTEMTFCPISVDPGDLLDTEGGEEVPYNVQTIIEPNTLPAHSQNEAAFDKDATKSENKDRGEFPNKEVVLEKEAVECQLTAGDEVVKECEVENESDVMEEVSTKEDEAATIVIPVICIETIESEDKQQTLQTIEEDPVAEPVAERYRITLVQEEEEEEDDDYDEKLALTDIEQVGAILYSSWWIAIMYSSKCF